MRKLLFALFLTIAAPVALTLQGCATFGLHTPQDNDQRIVYAKKQLEAGAKTIASAVRSKQLDPDKAQKALDIVKEGRTIADAAAFAFSAGDIATAEGRLILLTELLTKLQTLLNERAAP